MQMYARESGGRCADVANADWSDDRVCVTSRGRIEDVDVMRGDAAGLRDFWGARVQGFFLRGMQVWLWVEVRRGEVLGWDGIVDCCDKLRNER